MHTLTRLFSTLIIALTLSACGGGGGGGGGGGSNPNTTTASVQSTTQINLSWSAVSDASYYRLYQGGTSIYAGSDLNYSHTGLTENTAYTYTLKACTNNEESTCSNVLPATTATTRQSIPNAPSIPSALTASVQSATQINLSWSIVSGASYYEIYRNTSNNNNGLTRISDIVDPSNTYQDTGLDANIQYYYWLKACNSTTCSDFSSVASATIPTLVTLGEKFFLTPNYPDLLDNLVPVVML